jgi:DNA-binding response OmpR family regulator
MRPTALLIDDDAGLLAQLSAAFQAAGFRTFSAGSGRIGAQLAAAAAPDIVITDILMPDQEGIATIIQLKAMPRPPKVVAISGGGQLAREVVLNWASHLGADVVLPKPFPAERLVDAAKRLLEGPAANTGAADPVETHQTVEQELCAC